MINMNKKISTILAIIFCASLIASCDQNVGKRNIEENLTSEDNQ